MLDKNQLYNNVLKIWNPLTKKHSRNQQNIKIASINIRSLLPKIDIIKQFIYEENIDIVAIQETWINTQEKLPNIQEYRRINTKQIERRGTGLITYLRKLSRLN